MVAGRGNRHVILGTIEFLILTSKTLQLPPRIPNRAPICQYFLPLPQHSCFGTRIPTHGYLYASRLLITSLGSGLGPSRLGFTVTSLGSWPPAQPTRTHDHVPRLRASGPADSDPKSRPSAPGLVPSRLGLTRHPLTPAQIGHVMLGDTGTRPLPAAPSGGIPRSRLGLACLWRTPHSPPRRLGLLAPRRAARGASGPPRRSRLSRGPGLRAHPFSRRPAYDQSFKGIRPLLAGTWRTWCELRGRRHASTPASLPTPASPPVSRQDGLMRAWLSPACGVDLVPSPTSFPATRRDGLASELSLLGLRGGPHRTTQPTPYAAVLSEDLVGFNSQGQPT